MVPTRKLVYDFDRRYNASGRGSKSNITLVDKIAYLNDGMGVWFSQLADLYETSEHSRGELREFEEKHIQLDQIPQKDGAGIKTSVFKYPYNLYKRLNQVATVSQESCCPGIKKDIPITIQTTDKLSEVLRNPLLKPSFGWERISGDDAGHALHVYSGEMKVHDVYIDYLRKPQELHAPSLIGDDCTPQEYFDYAGREIQQDTFFEPTSRFADRKVVEIAVLFANGDHKDYNGFQQQLQSIIFGDNGLKN